MHVDVPHSRPPLLLPGQDLFVWSEHLDRKRKMDFYSMHIFSPTQKYIFKHKEYIVLDILIRSMIDKGDCQIQPLHVSLISLKCIQRHIIYLRMHVCAGGIKELSVFPFQVQILHFLPWNSWELNPSHGTHGRWMVVPLESAAIIMKKMRIKLMMTRLTAVDLFVWHESLGGGRRATIDVLIRPAGGSYSCSSLSCLGESFSSPSPCLGWVCFLGMCRYGLWGSHSLSLFKSVLIRRATIDVLIRPAAATGGSYSLSWGSIF